MFKRLRYLRWYYWGRWWIKNRIHQKVRRGEKIKIIIGSGKDYGEENGWIYTDIPHFDITKENDWRFFFSKDIIDNLLAEHVLEHLTETEVSNVIELAISFMKPGGCFRIAVPDENHPDPKYIERQKPFSNYYYPVMHYSFWSYYKFENLLKGHNCIIKPYEYYNTEKEMISIFYSDENGYVAKSKKNNLIVDGVIYSSVIIDIIKK